MTIKAIAMDMDGTLLNDEKQITPKTKAALMAAQKQGIKVILASGRPTPGLKGHAKELELEQHHGLLLSFNGAHVMDATSQAVLFEQPMEIADAQAILEHLKQFTVKPMICRGDYMFVNDVYDNVVHLPEQNLNIIAYEAGICGFKLCEIDDLAAFADFPLYKILTAGDPDYLAQHQAAIYGPFKERVSGLFSDAFYFEFTDKGITKGNALAQALPKLGIKPEEVIAFGDGQNDQSMLAYARVGVAMGNAKPEVKAMADEVTLTNNEDGIAVTLEKYL